MIVCFFVLINVANPILQYTQAVSQIEIGEMC